MPGAFGRPAQRCHLDFHAPPAQAAVAGRLHRQTLAAALVNVRRRVIAAVGCLTAAPAKVSGPRDRGGEGPRLSLRRLGAGGWAHDRRVP